MTDIEKPLKRLEEDKRLDEIAQVRDQKGARFVSHKRAWLFRDTEKRLRQ